MTTWRQLSTWQLRLSLEPSTWYCRNLNLNKSMGTKLETTHIIYVFGLHRENHVLNKENHHQCQYSSLLMWSVFILQQTWRSFWLSRTFQTPTFNTSCQNQQCIVEIKILAVRTKAESLQSKSLQRKTWLRYIIIQVFLNLGAFSSDNFSLSRLVPKFSFLLYMGSNLV